ncbi:MAG: NYN domain-containing protein [Rectinemataceae bacterium]|jgi:uncharacterized LabA/DUF88 family protein
MNTSVYIDGFNLYYGALKNTPYKWLDPLVLCRAIIPSNNVTSIKYFTAKVTSRPDDPDKLNRQNIYLRTLQTIPILKIYLGHFLTHVVRMPLAHPQPGQPTTVEVIKTEEKGSDVNLATQLLLDAWSGTFECAVVISGDSDLKTPILVVIEKFQKTVGVINPHTKPSIALKNIAHFYKPIRESALHSSQFPPVLTDGMGIFHKPASW